MAALNPYGIVLEAFSFELFTFTRFISGTVDASCVGKAVTIDNTADGTVKLAGDGDPVYGRIFQYEDRSQEGVKVVSVERKFIKRLPKSGTVARGDHVVGAGNGAVKTGTATAGDHRNHVLQVGSDYVVVEKL
jgi:hypothetical protein